MEKKVINRFYHEHPLILTENVSENDTPDCYGCGIPVTKLEATYVCMEQHCREGLILHKKCGELPSEILHPKHPQHPISLFDYRKVRGRPYCDICLCNIGSEFGYRCSTCDFDVDIKCPKISIDAILEEKLQLQHQSHPHHPLTLMRKSPISFYCDGCGSEDADMAYICSICELWIHKSCALLPPILPTNHHHHDLSLAFSFPNKHSKYIFDCDVCLKRLGKTCWVYFCNDCRFFAHLRCVAFTTQTTKQDSISGEDENGALDVIEFPLHAQDISKMLITPFVMREKGLPKIPDVKDLLPTVKIPETIASFSFLFNYHKHHLSLVSELSNKGEEDDCKKVIDEEDEDEDEASDHGLKICDVCITPISSPPYYECAACKYFVHSICYLLPKTLSTSSPHLSSSCPKRHGKNHKFTLYTSSKEMDMHKLLYVCALCGSPTNGMVYECEGCKIKIDVKCASIPTTITYAFHPHHKRLILTRIPPQDDGDKRTCYGCGDDVKVAYCCSSDDCDFALDVKCAMLPASITKQEWDNHPFLLMCDAALDHPSDFVCDFCEGEMNPKWWMYHCRQCDISFHSKCLRTASGWYRNIKLGQPFVLDAIHPHPLTFNCITIKRRCDICHMDKYDKLGLECASCNYVVCKICAWEKLICC